MWLLSSHPPSLMDGIVLEKKNQFWRTPVIRRTPGVQTLYKNRSPLPGVQTLYKNRSPLPDGDT
jgi:hypothetical protein